MSGARPVCYQLNLQTHFGGGEIYTRFFCRALAAAGWETQLLVAPDAPFWRAMGLESVRFRAVANGADIQAALPERGAYIVAHSGVGEALARELASRHTLTGIAHMPYYERSAGGLAFYTRVNAVSRHVLDSLRSRGLANLWPEPLYGVADLEPRPGAPGEGVQRGVLYDWDRRKWRDRLLGTLDPARAWLRPRQAFARRPGLTLGIVSRLTPIKQFPQMFSFLAPVIARYPGVNLEIFGNGAYASVRDLRRSLAPLAGRVRLWGYQSEVRRVYPLLDYVLSGLPEKEALGLNLIEAQACGTPVLAVNAPPFTETVLEGESGWLFADPRGDGGAGFGRVLERLLGGEARPDPLRAKEHLARFSQAAFHRRVAAMLADMPRPLEGAGEAV